MGSEPVTKPHAVLLPFPAQGHINPMLKLAKLLHSKGFHITFVHTEYNLRRLTRSRGPDAFTGLDDFRFEAIPDGLPPSEDHDATQDIPALCAATRSRCLVPFRDLVARLDRSADLPPVTCIVSDGAMGFTVYAAEELGIPELLFFTLSACGLMGYLSYAELVRRGYIPLKDESLLSNGYLDTPIDWIPGMKNVRLRDLPTFIRTTDPDDVMLNVNIKQAEDDAPRAFGVILNTFDELERDVVAAIRSKLPNLYTVGPLSPACRQIPPHVPSSSIDSNLWKEDTRCLSWLDERKEGSVVYVNFGSITVMTPQQLVEFAWGLADSGQPFLWVVRPGLVSGEGAMVPEEFVEGVEGRGLLVGWCNQEAVLAHPATGGFLTHCGWNSTLEAVWEGVPMVCWPFFAEQQTNCRYACTEWGIGMEIDNSVRREEVEGLVRELMGGEKGKNMRRRALEWKDKAREAIGPGGPSHSNLERLVFDMAHMRRK